MANRSSRRGNGNAIRGPQSALTDFLASHNISAHQISLDYQRRQEEAERQRAQGGDDAAAAAEEIDDNASDQDEDPVERKKRKRKEEMALMKIKQSKEFKRRKHENKQDSDYDLDDDDLARQMMQKAKPLPGQLDNCDICAKRFTVTPYSKTGPTGGLCCTKCSKGMKDEEKKAQKSLKKKPSQKGRKRQTESDRLMGEVRPGAKALVEQCVRRVADVVNDIDDFGDLPQNLLDRLSQILSKRRVLTSRTLQLFLQPSVDRISVYDCGRLETEDFQKIFAFMPDLESVNLRFAGQMKDDSLFYMLEKNKHIKHLQLGATNLISDEAWVQLFKALGPQLESLKLSELNDSLNDDSMEAMVKSCKNLRRLKLRSCPHITEVSMEYLGQLKKLEHLSLSIAHLTTSDVIIKLIGQLGPNLQTLSLEDYTEADDTVLDAIRTHCFKLSKLRFTGNSLCTDKSFGDLFGPASINPPMSFIDLSSNRDLDNVGPGDEMQEEDLVGFAGAAFQAMMSHSGSLLETLNLHSNRHISHQALLDVFDGKKRYPSLKNLDLSFVKHVDDVVMRGIFKSCPALTMLAVFACFNARGTDIPANIAVVGLPNAQDNIVVNADVLMDL